MKGDRVPRRNQGRLPEGDSISVGPRETDCEGLSFASWELCLLGAWGVLICGLRSCTSEAPPGGTIY